MKNNSGKDLIYESVKKAWVMGVRRETVELMGELKTEYSSTSIKATNLIKDDIQTTFNK